MGNMKTPNAIKMVYHHRIHDDVRNKLPELPWLFEVKKLQGFLMDCIQPSPKRCRRSASLDDDNKADCFHKLPDDILIEILDRLPVEEAMGTTFLSKRWKDLWKWKWNVELGYGWVHKTGKKVLPSLSKIFDALGKQDLRSICISFRYHHSMLTRIQSLIAYVSVKKVRELYIDFNGRNDDRVRWRRQYPFVPIPDCELHPCLALVKLSLKSLVLLTLPPSRFRALKELYLESVVLQADSVASITGNCPLLLLCLCNCNPYTPLNIFIADNSNLHHLIIREEVREVLKGTGLCIRAPNVRTIEFGPALPRKMYEIQGSLDCSEAAFRLNQMHCSRQTLRVTKLGLSRNFTKNFFGLLKKLRMAKVLTLSSWCIQVLAIELVDLHSPLTLDVTHLILETGLIRWEYQGIAYTLPGCNKLEKLVVIMGPPAELNGLNSMERFWYYNFMESLWRAEVTKKSSSHHANASNILQNLEVVEFRNPSNSTGALDGEVFNKIQFFEGFDCGMRLLWYLKSYAKNLQELIFTSGRNRFEV